MPGRGGTPANGGTPGSGGAPSAGGTSGTAGASGTTAECEDLIQAYDRELTKARECKDLLSSCGTSVPAKLAGCGSTCMTFVEKPDKLNDIREKWSKAACTAPPCPGHVCTNALLAVCSVGDGVCSDVL